MPLKRGGIQVWRLTRWQAMKSAEREETAHNIGITAGVNAAG
jgi:hypothetical protein